MCGGKSTTTQSTTIPPEVLARYNAVNTRAENVAQQPFRPYTGEFVAPLNATQQAGIFHTNYYANLAQGAMSDAAQTMAQGYGQATPLMYQGLQTATRGYGQASPLQYQGLQTASQGYGLGSGQLDQAQRYIESGMGAANTINPMALSSISGAMSAANPYMQSASQYTTAGLGSASPMLGAAENYLTGGTQAVNPEEFNAGQISKYMSPYQSQVINAQTKLAEQQNAIQRSALNSQAIGAGAFGGDRAGITQANLAGQQSLAQQATMANLLNQGYGQALGAFQQQQGVNLQAGQANRAAQQFGSQQAANLAQQRFGQQLATGQQMGALGAQQFQQNIGQGQALAGLGQQMYAQNLGAAQASQGLGQARAQMAQQLGAFEQATGANLNQLALQLAGFEQGTGANLNQLATQQGMNQANLALQRQQAGLAGAQAQLGAGTLEQQTRQAEDTARYQQFLQERGFDFQVAQFLANIAMGTGALSGSTTTTTAPNNFFSDRRLKKDIKEIGETHDGLPIYSFKYKGGDDQQRIGVMADEAREKHPDAVHRVGGIDAVDYEKIANRASEGGGVMPHRAGEGFALGGNISEQDRAMIANSIREGDWGPFYQSGLYGNADKKLPGAGGIVPQKLVPIARLQPHSAPPRQANEMQQALATAEQAEKVGTKLFGEKGYFTKEGPIAGAYEKAKGLAAGKDAKIASAAPAKIDASAGSSTQQQPSSNNPQLPTNQRSFLQKDEEFDPTKLLVDNALTAATGGSIRHKYSTDGRVASKIYDADNPIVPDYIVDTSNPEKIGDESGKGSKSGGSGSGSGLSNAIGMAGTAIKGGELAIKGLTALASLLPSDERFKTGMKRVGELDNGQPVYKYRIGNGPTQIGLSAQNVSKYGDPSSVYRDDDGFLHLDYERATREYGGGVRPGYANRGFVEGETDGGSSGEYKIDPISLKDMPEHRQWMVKDIYGPESGGRYNIRQGGQETFDINGPHPGPLPAKGGKSSAAGAGQFIYNTWNDVTGGAPMTEGYQDNATWTLAARDYNKRTGRDLDKDLQEAGGVTPEIRSALAPTWEAYQKQGGVKPSGEPRRQVAGAEYIDGKEVVDGKEQKSGLGSFLDTVTSPRVLAPLGTGLLAMATSPSRYFGGALLTGIGAGLAATQPSEASEQRIQAQRLENVGTSIDLVKKSYYETPNGMIRVLTQDGRDLSFPEWLDAGEPTPIAGGIANGVIKEQAKKLGLIPSEQKSEVRRAQTGEKTAADTGAPAPSAGQPIQPPAPGTQTQQQPPGAPSAPSATPAAIPLQYTVKVPESSVAAAKQEEKELYGMSGPDMAAQVARNNQILARAQAQKEAAIATGKKLTELAAPLASMAAGQEIAPGALAKINAFVADIYNGAVDQMKLPPSFKMNTQGLTDYQIAQKASGILTSEMAKNLNAEAYQALQYLAQSVASPGMQAGAARELLANAMVENQAALEEALFVQKYGSGRTKAVGMRATDEFRKNNTPEMYKQQKDAVKKLMTENINGVPVINYILRVGENRDPEIQKRFTPDVVNKKYGFNITRYILNMAD